MFWNDNLESREKPFFWVYSNTLGLDGDNIKDLHIGLYPVHAISYNFPIQFRGWLTLIGLTLKGSPPLYQRCKGKTEKFGDDGSDEPSVYRVPPS